MTWSDQRIGVVVVAFNAATTLMDTLDRIPADFLAKLDEILVLDDASEDDTFLQALAWAERHPGVTSVVVRHEQNLGYGGNQKAAYALASRRGLDVAVLLHGDGQYDPAYLPELVGPLVEDRADAVFGPRMMVPGAARAGGMPYYKWAGNRTLTRMQNRLLSTDLSEFHSGYRAYRVAALDRLPLASNSDGFDFDTQIIIQLLDQGRRILEVPIPTYYGDEICYVNGVKYAADVMRDVLTYRAGRAGFGSAPWVPTPADYGFKEGDGSSHAVILQMLAARPPGRVLDLGCSGGLLAERLRAQGHTVTGVDVVEVPGVRDRTDEFLLADLHVGLPPDLEGTFDVVVAGDLLEHLARPETLMRELRALVRPGGELVISVPNVSHWYPRARVALGAFGYDRRGPLDATHLRFFTRRSLRRFAADAGYDVLEEASTGLPLGALSASAHGALDAVRRTDDRLRRMRPQLFAYQFVLRLQPRVRSFQMEVFGADRSLAESGDQRVPVAERRDQMTG